MPYIGKQPVVGNFQVCDAITVVNGQAAYTMQVSSANVEPENANHMLVSLNGILQKPGSSFTISGATITFASNLATGDVIDFIILLGDTLNIGTPSDDSVGAAQIKNDLISGTTALASEPADTDEFLVSDAGTLKRIDYSLIKGETNDYKLLATATASDVSSFALNGYFTGDYDIYKLFLYNIYAGSSDQDCRIRVNTTGSYTEQTAQKYFYVFNRLDGTTSNSNNSEEAVQYETTNNGLMIGRMSNVSSKMSNTEITLYKPSDSSNFFQVTSHFGGWNSSTEICTGTSTGVYTATTAVTGITIYSQSGNISCEKAYLYGIKNS